MCLVVIGRYVPRLEFLDVLLGNEPVLTPAERLCQRLISGNIEEAIELAEAYTDEHGSADFYHEVAIPALQLAENDRRRAGDVEFRRRIAEGGTAVAREVSEHVRERETKKGGLRASPDVDASRSQHVLCIGGRTELDEAGADMLTARLHERGIAARTLAPMSVSIAAIEQMELEGIDAVCLIYFQPSPQSFARFVCRRLRCLSPRVEMIVCCWNQFEGGRTVVDLEQRIGEGISVVTTFTAAEEKVIAAVTSLEGSRPADEPLDVRDRALIDQIHALGLSRGAGPVFDEIVNRVAKRLGTSIVLVVPADENCRRPVSGKEDDPPRESLQDLLCREVIADHGTIIVADVADDERFAGVSELLEKGIRSFAAVPLHSQTGTIIGAVCVLDSKAAEYDDDEQKWLERLASDIVLTLEKKANPTEAGAFLPPEVLPAA